MKDYNKRLSEIDEILTYFSKEDLDKIPEDVKKGIKENKDKEYVWKYDTSKKLKDQNLSRDTIIILSYLNMEYLLNEDQKNLMKKIHDLNEKKKQGIIPQQQYNPEDLFNSQKEVRHINSNETRISEDEEMIVVNESILKKIINKIKNLLKVN